MPTSHTSPAFGLGSYTCPHCSVLARQYHWGFKNHVGSAAVLQGPDLFASDFAATQCESCKALSIWVAKALVHPNRGGAPPPNPEMPPDVRADYEEAARVLALSNRAAAALLRLAIQKLCIHLGGDGKHLDTDIGNLVAKGLPQRVQQALDIVRVIGNNAVHPGQIDVKDTDVAGTLFTLVNVITEYAIEIPKRVDTMYEALPEGARKAVDKRDGK